MTGTVSQKNPATQYDFLVLHGWDCLTEELNHAVRFYSTKQTDCLPREPFVSYAFSNNYDLWRKSAKEDDITLLRPIRLKSPESIYLFSGITFTLHFNRQINKTYTSLLLIPHLPFSVKEISSFFCQENYRFPIYTSHIVQTI